MSENNEKPQSAEDYIRGPINIPLTRGNVFKHICVLVTSMDELCEITEYLRVFNPHHILSEHPGDFKIKGTLEVSLFEGVGHNIPNHHIVSFQYFRDMKHTFFEGIQSRISELEATCKRQEESLRETVAFCQQWCQTPEEIEMLTKAKKALKP